MPISKIEVVPPLSNSMQDNLAEAAKSSRLRNEHSTPVTKEQGMATADKIGAVSYMECSARTQKGLKQVRTPSNYY